jgi:hypothetical protein
MSDLKSLCRSGGRRPPAAQERRVSVGIASAAITAWFYRDVKLRAMPSVVRTEQLVNILTALTFTLAAFR